MYAVYATQCCECGKLFYYTEFFGQANPYCETCRKQNCHHDYWVEPTPYPDRPRTRKCIYCGKRIPASDPVRSSKTTHAKKLPSHTT